MIADSTMIELPPGLSVIVTDGVPVCLFSEERSDLALVKVSPQRPQLAREGESSQIYLGQKDHKNLVEEKYSCRPAHCSVSSYTTGTAASLITHQGSWSTRILSTTFQHFYVFWKIETRH